MNKHTHTAVTVTELRAELGRQCSPDSQRQGYVIGPVYNPDGTFIRRAHVASCFSMSEARSKAAECNARNTEQLSHWIKD